MGLPVFLLVAAAICVTAHNLDTFDPRGIRTDSSSLSGLESGTISAREQAIDRAHLFIRSLEEEHDLSARQILAEILSPALQRRAPHTINLPCTYKKHGCRRSFRQFKDFAKHILPSFENVNGQGWCPRSGMEAFVKQGGKLPTEVELAELRSKLDDSTPPDESV